MSFCRLHEQVQHLEKQKFKNLYFQIIHKLNSQTTQFINLCGNNVHTSQLPSRAFIVQTKKEEENVILFHVFGFISHFTLFLSHCAVFLIFLSGISKKKYTVGFNSCSIKPVKAISLK